MEIPVFMLHNLQVQIFLVVLVLEVLEIGKRKTHIVTEFLFLFHHDHFKVLV